MHMNDLVDSIMNLLGMKNDFVFYSMTPFDIQEYIEKNTLRDFSLLRPYIFDAVVSFPDSDIMEYTKGSELTHASVTYRLPKEILELLENGLDIFSAGNVSVYGANHPRSVLGGDYIHALGSMNDITIPLEAYMMSAYGASVPRLRAVYSPPNKLIIKNGNGYISARQQYSIRLSCYHNKNLKTIRDGYMMAFRKYALLDIAHFVYHNNLKYFDQLNTGNSTTDLKLDLFEDIDNKRNEYIEELKSSQAIDSMASFIKSI